MKKAKLEDDDWLRPEYTRSDLGEIVRGKYADRLAEATNIVVLEPRVTSSGEAALQPTLSSGEAKVKR
ncbi:MAG TPA: hypothetical protein VFE33_34570 [Thermoanaerobaculia bacterium]|nr:hypothetical protein [Thermoanaerobaculia bacterium]